MDGSSPPLPNPVVYLNYLDPKIASDYEMTRNVYLATLGASHLSIIHVNTLANDRCSIIGFGLGHSFLSPARLETTVHWQAATCVFCLSTLEVGSYFFSSCGISVNFEL